MNRVNTLCKADVITTTPIVHAGANSSAHDLSEFFLILNYITLRILAELVPLLSFLFVRLAIAESRRRGGKGRRDELNFKVLILSWTITYTRREEAQLMLLLRRFPRAILPSKSTLSNMLEDLGYLTSKKKCVGGDVDSKPFMSIKMCYGTDE